MQERGVRLSLTTCAAGARAAVMLAAAWTAACAPSTGPRRVFDAYAIHWTSRDTRELSYLYSDDSVLRAPEGGGPRIGRADIVAYLRAEIASAGSSSMRLVAVEVTPGDPVTATAVYDVAFGGGARRWRLRTTLRDAGDLGWQMTSAEWTEEGVPRPPLGAACDPAVGCRGTAACVEGKCEIVPRSAGGGGES